MHKDSVTAKYRHALPQRGGQLFLTDGGIETTLIFLEGIELPLFASFLLFETPKGVEALSRYFHTYGALARKHDTGLILETATWRASPDWGAKLGYSPERLLEVDRMAIRMLETIRDAHESDRAPIVISGCLGPRGDGYIPDAMMSASESAEYHRPQIETFADTAADLVSVLTINYVEEAEGIAQAAKRAGMPRIPVTSITRYAEMSRGRSGFAASGPTLRE
jgi:homocysteine S-methyltransferase